MINEIWYDEKNIASFCKVFGKFSYKKFKINSLSPQWYWISYQSYMLVSLKIFNISCLLCVEFCQVLLILVKRFIMLPTSRSHTRHIYVLLLHWEYAKTCFLSAPKYSAPTLGEDKNMFVRFYWNKCSKFLIIFLSKVCCKNRHGLCKSI